MRDPLSRQGVGATFKTFWRLAVAALLLPTTDFSNPKYSLY